MKKFILAFALLVSVALPGCSLVMRPYEEPVMEEISTSETAFLVPLEDNAKKQKAFDSESLLKDNMVTHRRVTIPRRWLQTGRKWYVFGPHVGEYVPTVRLIKVDRKPVTVKWAKTQQRDTAVWVESNDSVGFSTGISLTGRIPNNEDAVKFLYNYPNDSLEAVLNEEVKARVQKVFASEAAKEDMNVLREKKNEIITAIEADIIPFFEERGIEITTVGQFGGFEYENPEIQTAIDGVFKAQQDKQVAIAEAQAAEERKVALKLLGEGEAAKALEIARGKAEAIQLEADAKAYEAQKLNEAKDFYLTNRELEVKMKWLQVWDGKLPTYLMGTTGQTELLLSMPNTEKSIEETVQNEQAQ